MNEFSDRQKQIISTSMELIADKGIQGFTIRNLSGEIGISEPAIYRHFDSKVDILLAILSYFKEDSLLSLEKILSSDGSAIGQLKSFFLGNFQRFKKEPDLSSVIFSEEIFQYDSKLAKSINGLVEHRISEITKFVSMAQKEGTISVDHPAEDIAYIILGSMRFLVTTWRLSGFTYDLTAKGDSLKKTLLNLIGE